jgi:hypothetical protein
MIAVIKEFKDKDSKDRKEFHKLLLESLKSLKKNKKEKDKIISDFIEDLINTKNKEEFKSKLNTFKITHQVKFDEKTKLEIEEKTKKLKDNKEKLTLLENIYNTKIKPEEPTKEKQKKEPTKNNHTSTKKLFFQTNS